MRNRKRAKRPHTSIPPGAGARKQQRTNTARLQNRDDPAAEPNSGDDSLVDNVDDLEDANEDENEDENGDANEEDDAPNFEPEPEADVDELLARLEVDATWRKIFLVLRMFQGFQNHHRLLLGAGNLERLK